MWNQNLLFCESDLDKQLRARQGRVSQAVDDIPKEQFLVCNDRELLDHILADLTVEPLVLRENKATMKQEEARSDRSFSHSPGTRVDVDIPFTGEKWIFCYRTNPFSYNPPEAEVCDGYLRISVWLPHYVNPEKFKENYKREVDMIKKYVEWSHKQVTDYNENLARLVQQAIANRRQRLSKHANIASLLDIPFAPKSGAPSLTPVKVEVRRPARLPVPPKTGLMPEPGITAETYEKILHCIRHQGRTFERTPATYAAHGEEDLRNIILAQINGHFKGHAGGEVFRGRGKTDIAIEQDNRAAFVGECKIWSGSAGLSGALDQLLSYLTWRDSKASLIMFNSKNRNFSNILKTAPEAVRKHPLFLQDLPCEEAGEWRVQMRSKED